VHDYGANDSLSGEHWLFGETPTLNMKQGKRSFKSVYLRRNKPFHAFISITHYGFQSKE
jgi:hypothetical protein